MDMDLGVIRKQAQETAWLTIQHPVTGKETSMRLKLLSPDSEAFRVIDTKIKNTGIQASRRRGSLTMEELNDSALELLAGVTVDWENVIFDGQQLEFSPENVQMLYREFPFVKEQADRFIADRLNFFTS